MKIQLITFVIYLSSVTSCTTKSEPPAFSFDVYTTRETRYEVVSLVEKFALRENLLLNTSYEHPKPAESRVSMDYADKAQKIAWMWVSNGKLKNQDHVQVYIYSLSDAKTCEICKKFEVSDEIKKIRERFEIENLVKNGEW